MIELKTFEWDKLNDEEYQEAIYYNCDHSEDILNNAIEDVKSKKKLSRILCKFGKHNYITFLIAPYICVPYFCDRCGERKPVDLEMEEEEELEPEYEILGIDVACPDSKDNSCIAYGHIGKDGVYKLDKIERY